MYIKNIDPFFSESKFEDTKEVIRSRKSKDRQYNGQKNKYKMTNNDKPLHRKLKINTNTTKNRGLT